MEKNPARHGPLPGVPAGGRPLSASRVRLLEVVQAQAEPIGLAALAAGSGLHENTVREHLDALIGAGLARRVRAQPAGRGRPAWRYEATGRSHVSTHTEYAALAAALAGVVARTSTASVADARTAGAEWGRRLAHDQGAPARPSAPAARRRVSEVLDRMGFAPRPDRTGTLLRLTRCPLLEAALAHPDVVCAVHLGIVEGVLAEYGYDGSDSELRPFAEPGACLLRLRTTPVGPS